jgi:transposase
MINIDSTGFFLEGPKGLLPVKENDEITLKLAMLIEGECEGYGRSKAAKKYGYTRQRYHQILYQFKQKGAIALRSGKTGPKNNYRRTDEVVRQIIRHRFLDPDATAEVIAQKLVQCGYPIAIRSVHRVISEYGLQKKTPSISSGKKSHGKG